jgi:WD repeat-containing protein 19
MLMRTEYRSQIDAKYAKKIEAVVRKAPKNIKQLSDNDSNENSDMNGNTDTNDELEDDFKKLSKTSDSSPCPICEYDLQNMDVTCSQCKTTLPICIATGNHISGKFENCLCPECDFPAVKAEMVK